MTRDELVADLDRHFDRGFGDRAAIEAILDRLTALDWRQVPAELRRAASGAHAEVRYGVIEDDYQRGRAHALDDVHRWLGLDQ